MTLGLGSAVLRSALKNNDSLAQNELRNLATRDVEGATLKRTRVTSIVSDSEALSLKSSTVRLYDEHKTRAIRSSAADADRASSIHTGSSKLRAEFEAVKAGESPKLVDAAGDLERALKISLDDPGLEGHKQVVVESSARLAEVISHAASLCFDAQERTQQNTSEIVSKVNADIMELSELNVRISRVYANGLDTSDLLDRRDKLVYDISSVLEVDGTTELPNGSVRLRCKDTIILDETHHAKVVFEPRTLPEITDGAHSGMIKIQRIETKTSKITFEKDLYNPDNSKDFRSIPNGMLKGNVELYEDVVPRYLEQLNMLAFNVRERFNEIHNKGSSSGLTKITSQKDIYRTDISSWTGSVRFGIVDSNGSSAKNDGHDHTSVLLDLGKFTQVNPTGQLTSEEIIREIDSLHTFSDDVSIGLGEDPDNSGRHLLADIKAVIIDDKDSQISFDFQMVNTSTIDSKIEILGVDVGGLDIMEGETPYPFSLQAGTKTRSFAPIRLNKSGLIGNQNVDVKIRVIGDNGVVQEGTIRYEMNFDGDNPNGKRIAGTRESGDIISTGFLSNRMMKAALRDKSGFLVESDGARGNFVFESTNPEYGIVIQDEGSSTLAWEEGFGFVNRNFGSHFGIGNLFNNFGAKNIAYNLSIREDISSDSSLFASSSLIKGPKETKEITKGVESAKIEIEFIEADTAQYDEARLSIGSKIFTLKNGAAASKNDIDISSATNTNEIIIIIKDHLKIDRELSSVVDFLVDGDSLVVKAKNPGLSGNNILVSIDSTTGTSANLVNNPLEIATNNYAHNLEGGSNETKLAKDHISQGYIITKASTKILSEFVAIFDKAIELYSFGSDLDFSKGTIINLFESVTRKLSSISDKIKRDNEVYESSLRTLTDQYKQEFGFNPDQHSANMVEIANAKSLIAAAFSIMNNSVRDLIHALLRG